MTARAVNVAMLAAVALALASSAAVWMYTDSQNGAFLFAGVFWMWGALVCSMIVIGWALR